MPIPKMLIRFTWKEENPHEVAEPVPVWVGRPLSERSLLCLFDDLTKPTDYVTSVVLCGNLSVTLGSRASTDRLCLFAGHVSSPLPYLSF